MKTAKRCYGKTNWDTTEHEHTGIISNSLPLTESLLKVASSRKLSPMVE
jgi:hypothetical protein